MARGDGIHRTSARNARMKDTDIDNAQAHKVQRYEDVIQRNNLWHFFRPRREKAAMRDDAR